MYDKQYEQYEYEEGNAAMGTNPNVIHDAEGRIIVGEQIDENLLAEDYSVFVSAWQPQRMASQLDWRMTSSSVWPDIPWIVVLRRFDVFVCHAPLSQQGTADKEESRAIRNTPGWEQFKTIFVLNQIMYMTGEFVIESAGPPRRCRFRWKEKPNRRDMGQWVHKESICAYRESVGIPGSKSYAVDWADSPDRYVISDVEVEPVIGMRRLSRFGGYPATQYYILQRTVHHECLTSEGGKGQTYLIRRGTQVFAQKNWQIVGSFYGFDMPLKCANKYTYYSRQDPFPRMQLCMGSIAHADEWTEEFSFYAFDIPVPGTCVYSLQHCVRSIRSTAAGVSRHRLTTLDAQMPWEFRYMLYTFPAEMEDCSLCDYPVEAPVAYDESYDPNASAYT